jgi:hypothetical protein
MRRSYIDAAIDFTQVYIREGVFSDNAYDPDTNKIFLNTYNDSWLGRMAKQLAGRPEQEGFSLAHELGHAVFNKMDLSESREFQKLFGKIGDEYGGGNLKLLLSRFADEPTETLTKYGATDPEEDFADCFGFLCTKTRVNIDRFDPPVRAKLRYVKKILERVRARK